jgi:hypothetical protein
MTNKIKLGPLLTAKDLLFIVAIVLPLGVGARWIDRGIELAKEQQSIQATDHAVVAVEPN